MKTGITLIALIMILGTPLNVWALKLTPKNKPPAPGRKTTFKFPKTVQKTLKNGLKVIVYEKTTTPVVYLKLWFRSGGAYEPKELTGLFDMLSGMMTEGTKTRSSKKISEEVAFLGASLSVSAGPDALKVSAAALSRDFSKILELMTDVTLNPTFPEKELKKKRTRALALLKYRRSQIKYHAYKLAYPLIYGKEHPYGQPYATVKTLNAISRKHLVQSHATHIVPNNAVLVVAGNVKAAAVFKLVQQRFGAWKRGKLPKLKPPKVPRVCGRRIHIVDRPTSVQSFIFLGRPSFTRLNRDYFKTVVMNHIFGGGATGRLFQNLREKRGLTYGAYSSLDAAMWSGDLTISTSVRNKVTGQALSEIIKELERIRSKPVTDDELNDARTYLVGRFPLMLETPGQIAHRIAFQRVFRLAANYWQRYPASIQRVTRTDVSSMARRYMTPKDMVIVVVGKKEAIIKQLKPIGPITVWDLKGNKLSSDPGEKRCKSK